jgi:hypothetical protein
MPPEYWNVVLNTGKMLEFSGMELDENPRNRSKQSRLSVQSYLMPSEKMG